MRVRILHGDSLGAFPGESSFRVQLRCQWRKSPKVSELEREEVRAAAVGAYSAYDV